MDDPLLLHPDRRRPGQRLTPVTVKLPGDLLSALDAKAGQFSCTRAELMRGLCRLGLERFGPVPAVPGEHG